MNKKEITYEPDNNLKKGYLSLLREIAVEIKENRWLTYQLFKRDFFATYKQSFFGIFWAFIVPFVSLGTFLLLNASGIFSAGNIKVPYPIYALLGISFWNLFSTTVISGADALIKTGEMLTKINFSRKSLVFASLGTAIISFLLQLIMVIFLFAHFKMMPKPAVLFLPLIIIPIIALGAGFGLVLSIINAVTRDIGKILPMLVTFLMFLTPVLYEKPKLGILTQVTKYNPLYYFISAVRDLTFNGFLSEPKGFYISCLFSIAVFLFTLLTFHLTETRIAERI